METKSMMLAPSTIQEAMSLSERFSKSGLVPAAFRGKPDDILLVLMGGMELGFSPVQALRSFYVIQGRLGMYSDAMVALCVRSQLCEYFKLSESTDDHATYVTKRRGSEPVTLTYTMSQAKQSGAAKNATYTQHPAAMLRARCSAALARVVYPDLVAGLYDPQEFVEEEAKSEPVQATVVSSAVNPRPLTKEEQEMVEYRAKEDKPEVPFGQGWDDESVLNESIKLGIENAKTPEDLLKIAAEANKLPKGPERDELKAAWNKRWAEVKK